MHTSLLVCKVPDMDNRANRARVGTRVSKAISTAGMEPASVAEAIGLTSSEFQERLDGVQEFSVSELVRTGGLLRVSSADLAGVA